MQTHGRVVVDKEWEPKRNWLIGIAVAAVVIIGGLLLVRSRDDPSTASDQTSSAVQLARDYLAAYAARDADRLVSHVGASVVSGLGGIETLRSEFRWQKASGFELLPGQCEHTTWRSSSTESWVTCPYNYHGIRSDEIGHDPFLGSFYDFTIRGGEIVQVYNFFQVGNGFEEVWELFASWVAATYPDDVAVMYTDTSQSDPLNTDESISLWEQRSQEYVEFVELEQAAAVEIATQFLQAWSQFDTERAATFLATNADLGNWQDLNRLQQAQGHVFTIHPCAASGAQRITVACPYDFHALHSDEMDKGPFSGSQFIFEVHSGEVFWLGIEGDVREFLVEVWEPFVAWIAETHPEDEAIMYASVSDESIALWKQRSREYAEGVGG